MKFERKEEGQTSHRIITVRLTKGRHKREHKEYIGVFVCVTYISHLMGWAQV